MEKVETMKKWFFPVSLILLFIILIAAVIPEGCLYGSNTDWLSQHAVLAETIRDACVEQHTLLPSWLGLGGGSNGFQFSYYGFLRPDILIGCLLPQVPMIKILIAYMLVIFLASVLICFVWLRAEGLSRMPAWAGSILFMTAGCLFHMHRQVMFVNYLPYLLLAFLCIRKQKYRWLTACLLLICLSSYYFSISAFAAVGWYWYRTEGRGFWKDSFLKRYLPSAAVSAGMAAALFLPTGLVLLEHRRGGGSAGIRGLLELLAPNPVFNNLLFNEYGMGLTFVCLYAILAGMAVRKRRADSILFLLFGLFGICSYLLNGTLYARPKILIPFMPLVILHTVRMLTEKNARFPLWPFAVIVPSGLLWFSQDQFPWILADAGILLMLILIKRRKSGHPESFRHPVWEPGFFLALLIAPAGLYFTTAGTDDWVQISEADAGFSADELEHEVPEITDSLYHFDSMASPLISANELLPAQTRSTMYSSVTNEAYSDLYYDTLLTPIRINNRVALLTSGNPFMLNLLGVRYLETPSGQIPAGYEEICRSGDTVIAENRHVLPIVYFTGDTISQEQFDALEPVEKLSAIAQKTVVADEHKTDSDRDAGRSERQISQTDTAGSRAYVPELALYTDQPRIPDSLEIRELENGWEINAEKSCTLTLTVQNPEPGNILLCQFGVENLTWDAVVIDINDVRNKLSGAFAPYPNGNNVFHYQFSDTSGQGITQLEITFSKGHYRLTDPRWYLFDQDLFANKEYTPLTPEEPDAGAGKDAEEILRGTVHADRSGYLATSIPRQNGLSILADGKEAELVTVNEAFAGIYLTEGEHTIEIRFSPPGKTAGILISLISAAVYGLYLIASKRRKRL